jgi:L-ribulokinase
VEEAQGALCPSYQTVQPDARSAAIYQELFPIYRRLYFGMGRQNAEAVEIGGVLPALRRIAAEAHGAA